jgi:hypothetical protein
MSLKTFIIPSRTYPAQLLLYTLVVVGCSSPTPHTGSKASMLNEAGESIVFSLTPDRLQTPRTGHLALSPNVTYFAPYSRIVSEEDREKSSGDIKAYKLSIVFNTEEVGRVVVHCDAHYSYGFMGTCTTTVTEDIYSGPLNHYPPLK